MHREQRRFVERIGDLLAIDIDAQLLGTNEEKP